MTTNDLEHDLLDEDPNSQAVEADEDLDYKPYPDDKDGVVVVEPDIITIGRKNRKDEQRNMSQVPQKSE